MNGYSCPNKSLFTKLKQWARCSHIGYIQFVYP